MKATKKSLSEKINPAWYGAWVGPRGTVVKVEGSCCHGEAGERAAKRFPEFNRDTYKTLLGRGYIKFAQSGGDVWCYLATNTPGLSRFLRFIVQLANKERRNLTVEAGVQDRVKTFTHKASDGIVSIPNIEMWLEDHLKLMPKPITTKPKRQLKQAA